MKTAKETVKTLLERLPDKCTIEDILSCPPRGAGQAPKVEV